MSAAPDSSSCTGAADPGGPARPTDPLRVRTLTAFVALERLSDVSRVEEALDFMSRAKRRVEDAGYPVQTLRVVSPSLLARAEGAQRRAALADITRLDTVVRDRGALLSIGAVLEDDRYDATLPAWAVELVQHTRATSFSIVTASPSRGHQREAVKTAAETTAALSRAVPGGLANFRFATAANVPPGTPFFPVAHHEGRDALAVGLEAAGLVTAAGLQAGGTDGAECTIRDMFEAALQPIASLAASLAREGDRQYLGIDPSPAPGLDRSIGDGVEMLTGRPFGAASTLDACGTITAAIKTLRKIRTVGYAGLMLPVLEDRTLARRAAEGRYGLRELLLYSSMCGTGLDVVPLPGDTSVGTLSGILHDVAALSVRLQKPLSTRLFPMPGRAAGDEVQFEDSLLTGGVVFRAE